MGKHGRIVWMFAGVLVPVFVAAAGWVWLRGPSVRPNILLVTVDTLRADHLGLYGYDRPTSPNLDALAAQSVVFDLALTHASLSGPSHSTMLTGLYPLSHGVVNNGIPLPEDRLTLQEILGASGYSTAMFVSHGLVGPELGFGQGFDHVELHELPSHLPGHRHRDDQAGAGPLDGVFRAASRWIEQVEGEPFFVWLHVQHPHKSYEPPPPYDTVFGPTDSDRYDLRCRYTLDDHSEGAIDLSESELDRVVALYDGEIAYVDAELGRVFDALQQAGVDERTAIAITADHGELLFDDSERRIAGHGRYRFDPVLRVPLVVRLPGTAGGSRVPEMVGLIDLAPTLLELAGVKPPAAMEGHSLVPLTDGRRGPDREASFSLTLHSDGVARLAARTRELKLICDKQPNDLRCALFDLVADPAERVDVADVAGFRDRREALTRDLERWYREGMASGALHALGNRSEKARKLLERAGYLREGVD